MMPLFGYTALSVLMQSKLLLYNRHSLEVGNPHLNHGHPVKLGMTSGLL